MAAHAPSPSPFPSPRSENRTATDGIITTSPSSSFEGPVAPSSDGATVMETEGATQQAIDMLRHPKGKRKRTAAKDKAILEAAYTANPKPDKAARLEIVDRVSLNEKEVQIWFQNRRQNDRRKSRPLSPQEVAALQYGGMQILSSDPPPYSIYGQAVETTETVETAELAATETIDATAAQDKPPQEPRAASPSLSDPAVSVSFSSDEGEKEREKEKEGEKDKEKQMELPRPDEVAPYRGGDEGQVIKVEAKTEMLVQEPVPCDGPRFSQSFSGSIGYLSNRWNPGSSFSSLPGFRGGDDSFKLEPFVSSFSSSVGSAPILPPPSSSQSSQFRLSLSLEGKAEVVSSNPSPPRPSAPRPSAGSLRSLSQIRRPTLHRSHSASSLVTLPPISTLTSSLPGTASGALPPRLTRGRSRDVHAWEFCCDAENREDALTAQAKHESTGSAIAAISLLRSTSSSAGPLQPSSSAKRNAPATRAAPRDGLAKKQKLGRALSSVARLQTGSSTHLGERNSVAANNTTSDPKKVKVSMLVSPSGNDSDKENWSPDEEGNPRYSHYQYYSHQPSQQPHNASVTGRRPLPSAVAARSGQANPRRSFGRALQADDGRTLPSLFANSRANTAPVSGRHQPFEKRKNKALQQRGRSPLEIFEDNSEEEEGDNGKNNNRVADDEVERFMRGEVSPSKRGDVDAVAGLLSLSQGNWR